MFKIIASRVVSPLSKYLPVSWARDYRKVLKEVDLSYCCFPA
jgi:hypothetical protein